MNVLICGDRHWDDRKAIAELIAQFSPDTVVIHGAANGADTIAEEEAKKRGLAFIPFEAEWTKYKGGAGPKRNQKMLDEGKPEAIYAFHNDIAESKGTRSMIYRSLKAGKNVTLISRKNGEITKVNILPAQREEFAPKKKVATGEPKKSKKETEKEEQLKKIKALDQW